MTPLEPIRQTPWSGRRILGLLIPLALFYAYFPGMTPEWHGANEGSYLYGALALYERGTPVVNEEVRRFGRHEDLAHVGGRYYSNKPPGGILLLAAAAPLVDLVTPGRLTAVEMIYFGRLLIVTLPFLLFLYLLGRRLEVSSGPTIAWGLVLAYGLASGAAVYATMLYTHNLVTALYGTAFILLGSPTRRRCVGAGALAGWGLITEYQSIALFAALALVTLVDEAPARERLARLTCYLAGAFPAALAAAAYNQVCFGHVYKVPYEYNPNTIASKRPYGLGGSSLRAWYGLWLSPSRGLLFYTPWLALGYLAARDLWRRWRTSAECRRLAICLGAPVLSTTLLASYTYWHGGMSVGPRYLLSAAHFLLYPLAYWLKLPGSRRQARVFWVAAGIALSAAVHALVLAAFPLTPWLFYHPFVNTVSVFCLEALRRGIGTYTLANHFGLSVEASWCLAALLLSWIAGFYSWHGPRRSAPAMRAACLIGALCGAALLPLWLGVGLEDGPTLRKFRDHLHRELYPRRGQPVPLQNR